MKAKLPYYLLASIFTLVPWVVSADTSLSTFIEQTGESIDDEAGYAMAAGDINGDGYEDMITSAIYNDDGATDAGAVYLIYGRSTALADASFSTRIEFTGEAANDNAGNAVATGDINNDGFDDILIGARANADGGFNAGTVYLIYGQANHLSSGSLSTRVQFTGEAARDAAGVAVTTGDVNNDGYADILIGANGNDDGGSSAGAIYLIYGQPSAFASASLSTGVEFTGEVANDDAGNAVATGDINADGYDDILVGDSHNDDGAAAAGAVYLIYGQPSAFASASLSTGVEFTGEAASDNAGNAVATGDINNDGYDDILIGALGNDDGGSSAGAAYLIYGKASTLPAGSLSTRVQFTGEAASNFAGQSVATGDVNNDGYDDILIGAYTNSDGGSLAGAVYLIYGRAANWSSTALSTFTQFTGEAANDLAGQSVAMGDLNNDDFMDVMIGANYRGDGDAHTGSVYLGYLYIDGDGDGVAGTTGLLATGTDCNDADSAVSANQTYYLDGDGDGYGGISFSTSVCSATAPTNYVANSSDHNDYDADNDNTITPDDCDDTDSTIAANQTYYQDSDGDGLGNAAVTTSTCSLTPPTGYVINSSDTDDTVASGDSDNDDDGVDADTDCNDADATVSAYQTYYQDSDGDGLGNAAVSTYVCSTTVPTGYVTNAGDADDTDDIVGYGAIEIGGDEIDNDGDSLIDEVNTLAENGAHPEYGDDDVTAGDIYTADISDITGTTNGDILVTYTDNSVYQYDIFTVTSTKDTLVTMKPDSSLAVVVHPKARKISLVNVLSGEVLSQKTLNGKPHSKVKLLVKDLRTDDKYEAIIVAKRGTKTIHVDLFSIKVASLKLKLRDQTVEKHKKILPSKTKAKNSKVKLRRQNGKVVQQYSVNKKYHLVD